jgi:hypothetical protein
VIGHRSSNELLADKPPFLREVSDSLVSAKKNQRIQRTSAIRRGFYLETGGDVTYGFAA